MKESKDNERTKSLMSPFYSNHYGRPSYGDYAVSVSPPKEQHFTGQSFGSRKFSFAQLEEVYSENF